MRANENNKLRYEIISENHNTKENQRKVNRNNYRFMHLSSTLVEIE